MGVGGVGSSHMRQSRQDMGVGRQRGDDDAMILPTWTVLSLHVTDPSCYLRVLGGTRTSLWSI